MLTDPFPPNKWDKLILKLFWSCMIKFQIDLYKQRTDEAYTTVEAYRIAFEEQILRNKELAGKLAEMCTPSNSKTKGSKAKNVIKWIITSLNEGR